MTNEPGKRRYGRGELVVDLVIACGIPEALFVLTGWDWGMLVFALVLDGGIVLAIRKLVRPRLG